MLETIKDNHTIKRDPLGFEKYMLELSHLTKVYPTPNGDFVVLENLNLKIREGEFVSIIGHSGCGKTTLLSMIAGLNPITGGQIILDGTPITGPGPDRGVIFQSPSYRLKECPNPKSILFGCPAAALKLRFCFLLDKHLQKVE